MNKTKSIIERSTETPVEFKTVNSVKKAIEKMEINTADSKNEFDEIATSINQIDAFYEKMQTVFRPRYCLNCITLLTMLYQIFGQ